MLRVLGLQRSNLGSREIDLLTANSALIQADLLPQELIERMAYNYGVLPEQAQEGMHTLCTHASHIHD